MGDWPENIECPKKLSSNPGDFEGGQRNKRGPISSPEDTEYIYEHTDAVGFVGASSIERIPVERAVQSTTEALKSKPLKKGKG
ncbi:MAG: phosphoenolpyruvate hydrolase family protein [Deltaproteobacteria bacterium]|nr:phosphoenolpyruvate hydrolase family protein [Deltaproteobacteria bacterium]